MSTKVGFTLPIELFCTVERTVGVKVAADVGGEVGIKVDPGEVKGDELSKLNAEFLN